MSEEARNVDSNVAIDKRVCLYAVQELSNARNGGPLTVDGYPDEVERQQPAIDLVAHDRLGTIIAEHTRIESYPAQLYDNKRVTEVFAGFADRFGHSLDAPGCYTLAIDTGTGHAFPRKNQAYELDRLTQWVRSQSLPVPELPPHSRNHVTAEPPTVPIPVTLYRMGCHSDDDGSLRVAFHRSPDLETQRAERIDQAFLAKAPKLEAARHDGDVTLLVLESSDYIMSNPVLVAQGVYAAAKNCTSLPGAIICVDTTAGEGHWLAYRIKNLTWWSNAALDLPRY
jgi:hypothetical protein